MPARIISLWLTTSASAGASLSVEMKNWEAFIGVAMRRMRRGARKCGERRMRVSEGLTRRQRRCNNELSSKIWG